MKPRTKETLRYLFGSLINNDACIAGGRERAWYFAIPMAILSVLMAVTPIMTTYFTISGASIVTSDSYGIDSYLIGFQEALYEDGVSMEIAEDEEGDHYLVTNFDEQYAQTTGAARYELIRDYGDGTTEIVFRAYYYGDIDQETLSSRRDTVLAGISPNSDDEDSLYDVTTMFFSDTYFYISVAPYYDGENSGSSIGGDYEHLPVGFDLGLIAIQDLDGNAYDVGYNERASDWSAYVDNSLAAWSDFFDKVYINTAYTYAWTQTGIAAGVFAAMAILMGLMVFLMTRGKNNPFRIYTFWECQKIAYWESFTPGLLTLILGFLLPSYALLLYVAFFGFRTVWLTLKSLRPS